MTRSRKTRLPLFLVTSAVVLVLGLWLLNRHSGGERFIHVDQTDSADRLTALPDSEGGSVEKPDYPGQTLTREHTALTLKKFAGIDLPKDAKRVASGVERQGPGSKGVLSFETNSRQIPVIMEAIAKYWRTNGQVARYEEHPERHRLDWVNAAGLKFEGIELGNDARYLTVNDTATSLVLPKVVNRALGLRPDAQTRDFYLFFYVCPTKGYVRMIWQHYSDGPYGDSD